MTRQLKAKGRQRRRRRRRDPPRAQVMLDGPAFVALVAAATEAYRRECYGVLLGTRRLGRVYIRLALAYQTARRKPKSVEVVDSRRRTVRQVLQAFPKYDYVGEFHSHPGYGDEPGHAVLSETDLTGVQPGECQLVIAVRKPRSTMPWQVCADGSLSGVAGKHLVRMKAYLVEPLKKGGVRGRPVGLRCTYAVGTASSPRLLAKRKLVPGP